MNQQTGSDPMTDWYLRTHKAPQWPIRVEKLNKAELRLYSSSRERWAREEGESLLAVGTQTASADSLTTRQGQVLTRRPESTAQHRAHDSRMDKKWSGTVLLINWTLLRSFPLSVPPISIWGDFISTWPTFGGSVIMEQPADAFLE